MIQTYKPKVGDVILVHNDTVLSDLVIWGEELELLRKGEKWPSRPIYSHSAVFIGEGNIVEAVGRGVTVSRLSKYYGKADIWSAPIHGIDRTQMRKTALDMVAQHYTYSWWLDMILAVRMTLGLRLRWVQHHAVNCSAATWDVWASAGHRIAVSRACSPEDICMWGYLEFMGQLDATVFDDE